MRRMNMGVPFFSGVSGVTPRFFRTTAITLGGTELGPELGRTVFAPWLKIPTPTESKERLFTEFKIRQPHVTTKDIHQFEQFLALQPDVDLYQALYLHRSESLPNKIILMKMLETSAVMLQQKPAIIQKLREQLGFSVLQAAFQDSIQMAKDETTVGIMNMLSLEVERATSSIELESLYQRIKTYPRFDVFQRDNIGPSFRQLFSKSENILDFLLLGKMNEEIHKSLYNDCLNNYFFLAPTSIALTDKKAFDTISLWKHCTESALFYGQRLPFTSMNEPLENKPRQP